MITAIKDIIDHRELIAVLAWKNIAVRYKQAYLGIGWAILKPIALMLVFTLVRSFVGIPSGNVPYPVLAFAALMPWIFFQESASEGVLSVVGNAALIRKIYFPREVFPITSMMTKLVELAINAFILAGLEEKGLTPNPPASRPELVRRLYYDLTGLPPTPTEVAAFLADESP